MAFGEYSVWMCTVFNIKMFYFWKYQIAPKYGRLKVLTALARFSTSIEGRDKGIERGRKREGK